MRTSNINTEVLSPVTGAADLCVDDADVSTGLGVSSGLGVSAGSGVSVGLGVSEGWGFSVG